MKCQLYHNLLFPVNEVIARIDSASAFEQFFLYNYRWREREIIFDIKSVLEIIGRIAIIFLLIIATLILALYSVFYIFNYLSRPNDLEQGKINGQEFSKLKNKTVIAVVAHPDDVDWYCGGTLSLLHKHGNKVVVVVGTSGEKGGNGVAELAEIREKEQLRAAKILGYDKVIFLRHPDRNLKANKKFKSELKKIFENYKPDILFTFDTEREGYIYRHSDHEAAGIASIAVAKEFKGVNKAYLFHSSSPNTIVDVFSVTGLKTKALGAHKSQQNAKIRKILRWLPFRPSTGGSNQSYPKIGVKQAEVFRETKI